MEASKKNKLNQISLKTRRHILESTFHAKSGHPGGSLSCVDFLTYLYFERLNIKSVDDPKRDRFVLSKGHAAPTLYSTLAQKGFFSETEINSLRKIGSILQGHPDMKRTPGVEISTGSLGQGFSASAGIALALKKDSPSSRVFALLGDGEIQEGIVWETAMFASHYKLNNLIAAVDNNKLQIDGKVEDVMNIYPIAEKFVAFGWNVIEKVDGHDWDSLENAIKKADEFSSATQKPTLIVLDTIKGKGVSFMENKAEWHGKAANAEELELALKELS